MTPTLLPRSEIGLGASCTPAACDSLVGSKTRMLIASVLRWLAVDAGADRGGHRLGLAAHPRRNDGAEAAGRAAGGNDQQMIGRLQRGVTFLGAVAHDRALADRSPIAAADAGALIEKFGDVALTPARSLDVLAELFRSEEHT